MASAALSAAGSIGGAVASGKSAKKVARIQAKTAADEMAMYQKMYDNDVARYQPEINYGNSAESLYNGAIGNGGDANAAANALAAFQNSTGYQTTLKNDLNAVNANAYASGLGHSGQALKALQDRGAYDAQQSFQNWLGNLNTSVQTGAGAKAALTGASQVATAGSASAAQNSANASSNAALSSGNAIANAFQNLGNIASNAYQSSYGSGGLPNFQWGQQGPISVYNNPDYSAG